MKLICKFCGYEWDYNGRMTLYANCPNCRKSIKIKEEEQKKDQEEKNK